MAKRWFDVQMFIAGTKIYEVLASDEREAIEGARLQAQAEVDNLNDLYQLRIVGLREDESRADTTADPATH